MDVAILGVVIGAAITLIGNLLTNFINHWFTSSREKAQWNRQQEAEAKIWYRETQKAEEERSREARKARKEYLHSLYQSSIQNLSTLSTSVHNNEELDLTDEKTSELVEEVFRSVSALITRRPDLVGKNSELLEYLDDFMRYPEDNVHSLQAKLVEIATTDKVLFPDLVVAAEWATEKPGTKNITIQIDQNFRRQQLVEGFELPKSFSFKQNFSNLTQNQREKLSDIYFSRYGAIPATVDLYVPSCNPQDKALQLSATLWTASLNPLISSPEEILKKWESDYEEALRQAQAESNRGERNT